MANETSPAIPHFDNAPLIRGAFSIRTERKPVSSNYYDLVKISEAGGDIKDYTGPGTYGTGWGDVIKKYEMRRAVITVSGKKTYLAGSEGPAAINDFKTLSELTFTPVFETPISAAWGTGDTSMRWFSESMNVADTTNHTATATLTYKGFGPWELVKVEPDAVV